MKPKRTATQKLNSDKKSEASKTKAYIENAGVIIQTPVVDALIENYMPYAMSVIVSRALPEIDGFKPAHRKLLYTMYKMGLLNGSKTKSANIVGQTMRLNPHGDQAIYETMVRLSRGNEALLIPFVDSKGNFGKAYSRDMAYAASRYTEAKLESVCKELFDDLDFNAANFIPNYDNTTTEPTLLPVKFPTILVNNNVGIAVSMASNICSFRLSEVCDTTIALIKDPNADIISTLYAPDFPGGGKFIYDENALKSIYETGRGSFKIRAVYVEEEKGKNDNIIEFTQIPPTTTVEAIMDKIVENVKLGKLKEISDARDETDLNGLRIAVDLKRGSDRDVVLAKLFKLTPLEDTFSCNFNVLIDGSPRVVGVRELLNEWILFREKCVFRKITHKLKLSLDKQHLLEGLAKILLDIDKAIKIVRETIDDNEVVINLMKGFGIDEIQADYVAEIKLRHLNRDYIFKRTKEIQELQNEIGNFKSVLDDAKKIRAIIIAELREISKKYDTKRKTEIIYQNEIADVDISDETPNYQVICFVTNHGYFKKITPQSLRQSNQFGTEHKLKDDDKIKDSFECTNRTELLFFTDKNQVYKSVCSEFSDSKASSIGDFSGGKLNFDNGEKLISVIPTDDYSEILYVFFENGKCAKFPLEVYSTKTKRRKLVNAISDLSPVVKIISVKQGENPDFVLESSGVGKRLIFSSALIGLETKRNSKGVKIFTLDKSILDKVEILKAGGIPNADKYLSKKIPSKGSNILALT